METRSPVRRKPRIVTLAIVASVAVHLAIVPFLRAPASARMTPPDVFHLDRSHAHPLAIPPPPPAPKPRIVRAVLPPRRVVPVPVVLPRTHTLVANAPARDRGVLPTTGSGAPANASANDSHAAAIAGADAGTPSGVAPAERATAEPAATPTVAPIESPACANAPRDASVLDAVTPDRPAIAAEEGAVGRAEVRVDLSATGAVLSASIYRSAGNAALDNAAIDAARRATFAPATDGCRAVAGSYVYTVDYSE